MAREECVRGEVVDDEMEVTEVRPCRVFCRAVGRNWDFILNALGNYGKE